MLNYDSVHDQFRSEVAISEDYLLVDNKKIRLTSERAPCLLSWDKVEIVFECTGLFLNQVDCLKHIQAGANKVLISTPSNDSTPMFVFEVNQGHYEDKNVISAASCTTNFLAPMAKVVHDNWGIRRGLMTTIHAATAGQKTVDSCSKKD
jgi:glyceraldehyde 3-phosphate dehydrogenase